MDTRIDVDSAQGHDFANYTFNNDATCAADGTESSVCTRCGEMDTRIDVDSAQGHDFANYMFNNDATCTADGTESGICNRCGEVDTRIASGTKQEHAFGEWRMNTEEREVRYCQVCREAEFRATEKLPTEPYIDSDVRTIALVVVAFVLGFVLGLACRKKRK
jgi:hypothetical protein